MRYRLRQVQDLCDLDLRDPQDLLRVTMARLVVRLLGDRATVSGPATVTRKS